jgi:hypothetical protein
MEKEGKAERLPRLSTCPSSPAFLLRLRFAGTVGEGWDLALALALPVLPLTWAVKKIKMDEKVKKNENKEDVQGPGVA